MRSLLRCHLINVDSSRPETLSFVLKLGGRVHDYYNIASREFTEGVTYDIFTLRYNRFSITRQTTFALQY